MRKYLISAALLFIAAGLNAGSLKLQDINIRDPFILVDKGVYYMYASSTVDGIGGVGVYTSRDLNDWEPLRQVMILPEGNWSTGPIWATFGPEGYAECIAESAPFKDNLYSPGLYFSWTKNNDRIYTGLEHRSNGRPYFGNPVAEDGYDDLSRGMNYAFVNWSRFMGPHTVTLEARFGVGCGVGDYEDHQRLFTQDLFLYYLGYFTAEYRYNRTHFGLHASLTPIWNESVANALLELEWHFHEGWPWLMLQYHYGYDETMCSCVKGAKPPMNVRIGLSCETAQRGQMDTCCSKTDSLPLPSS